MALPSLYKARGMSVKRPVCAICLDRTRGPTVSVRLTHGVTVWLCEGHASPEFQMRRSGRDFVLTLQRLWKANGCLTAARSRALSAHLAERPGSPKPGSYSWPALRRLAEAEFAKGGPPQPTITWLRELYSAGAAAPPSVRTMRRWHRERRWLGPEAKLL